MPVLKDIIHEVESLPVEERALVVDSILRTLNPPDSAIDRIWAKEAHKRLASYRSGTTKGIPVKQVFMKIQDHLKT